MSEPKIETLFVELAEGKGYIQVMVNGIIKGPIACSFDAGNDVRLITGLQKCLSRVYEAGRREGEDQGRDRVKQLIDWANGQANNKPKE